MRLHIELRDELVAAIDEVAGPHGRSRFIREALEQALKLRRQKYLLGLARGSIDDAGRDWGRIPPVGSGTRGARTTVVRVLGR